MGFFREKLLVSLFFAERHPLRKYSLRGGCPYAVYQWSELNYFSKRISPLNQRGRNVQSHTKKVVELFRYFRQECFKNASSPNDFKR